MTSSLSQSYMNMNKIIETKTTLCEEQLLANARNKEKNFLLIFYLISSTKGPKYC